MAGSHPEDMIENESFLPLGRFWKRRRSLGLLPALAEICGAENGWAEVSGARGDEQGSSIAVIEHHVVHNVAQEDWVGEFPRAACLVAAKDESTLAGADQHGHRSHGRLGNGMGFSFHGLLKVEFLQVQGTRNLSSGLAGFKPAKNLFSRNGLKGSPLICIDPILSLFCP